MAVIIQISPYRVISKADDPGKYDKAKYKTFDMTWDEYNKAVPDVPECYLKLDGEEFPVEMAPLEKAMVNDLAIAATVAKEAAAKSINNIDTLTRSYILALLDLVSDERTARGAEPVGAKTLEQAAAAIYDLIK
jgi:hypothetical protein